MCRPGELCCRQYYAREMWEYLESLITYTCCLHWLWTGSGLRRTTFLIFGKHVNMFSLLPGEVRCCELRWTELLCVAWCEQFPSANDMKWYDLVISVIISVNSTRFTQQPAHSIHSQINSNNIMSEQSCKQQKQFSHTESTRTFQAKALDWSSGKLRFSVFISSYLVPILWQHGR